MKIADPGINPLHELDGTWYPFTMQDFRRLRAWQVSHRLTVGIYESTSVFPPTERFGLAVQLRRSSVSIGSNIAEGAARLSDKDFRRFLGMAMGSASELEYQLLLSRDLGFIDDVRHDHLAADVSDIKRMLTGLIRSLEASLSDSG